VWFAIDRAARSAALAGAAFLAIHALIHLWDAAAGRGHAHQLLVDLPTVFLPPALAIWIAWSPKSSARAKSLAPMKETHHDQMVSEPLDRQVRANMEL